MRKTIDVYFDFGSPASYLGWKLVTKLAAQTGAELNWKPMLLGGVFKLTGNAPPISVPAKGRYVSMDLERTARQRGIPFEFNPSFPINTLITMRGATAYLGTERWDEYLETIFNAMWVTKRDMNDPAEVAAVLAEAGFDPQEFMAKCGDQAVKEKLKASTEEAASRGVFGAPTFFVGDDMYFGQDRLEAVENALKLGE